MSQPIPDDEFGKNHIIIKDLHVVGNLPKIKAFGRTSRKIFFIIVIDDKEQRTKYFRGGKSMEYKKSLKL